MIKTYHSDPITVIQVFLVRPTDALRFMQAEQTVVELANNIFSAQEIVKQPSLAESADVSSEDGRCVRSEVAWLVHGDQDILELEALKFKISWT